jgi:hypothetical protein
VLEIEHLLQNRLDAESSANANAIAIQHVEMQRRAKELNQKFRFEDGVACEVEIASRIAYPSGVFLQEIKPPAS